MADNPPMVITIPAVIIRVVRVIVNVSAALLEQNFIFMDCNQDLRLYLKNLILRCDASCEIIEEC